MCEVMEGGGESNMMSETVNCGELQEVADRKPKFCGKKEKPPPPPHPSARPLENSRAEKQSKKAEKNGCWKNLPRIFV